VLRLKTTIAISVVIEWISVMSRGVVATESTLNRFAA
jgi:hypothetical protein